MLSRDHRKHKKGFTIIELLFVIMVFSILMLAIVKITMDSTKVFKRGMLQSEMKQQLRRVMDSITTDVRQAAVIVSGTEWQSPPTGNDKVNPVINLKFQRYVYDSGDQANPEIADVEYILEPSADNLYQLKREITIGGVIRSNIIAENLYVAADYANGSYFKWAPDEIDTGKVVNDAIVVRLMMKAYHGEKLETMDLETRIGLRSVETSSANPPMQPTQYNVYMDSPTSLMDPR